MHVEFGIAQRVEASKVNITTCHNSKTVKRCMMFKDTCKFKRLSTIFLTFVLV